nr:metallophosphoesterase [Frankia sp. ArI3]
MPVLPQLAPNAHTPTHTLIQISDTHIVRSGERLYDKVDTHAVLSAVLAQLEASPLQIGVLLLTGDLADSGDPLAYRRLRELVEPVAARMGVPVLYGMGNHDARGPFRAGLLGVEPTTEPHDYTHWVGDLRVIVLDSTEPGQHGGFLSTAQLGWLADELATPAPAGTVLALHHPPVPSPDRRGQHAAAHRTGEPRGRPRRQRREDRADRACPPRVGGCARRDPGVGGGCHRLPGPGNRGGRPDDRAGGRRIHPGRRLPGRRGGHHGADRHRRRDL